MQIQVVIHGLADELRIDIDDQITVEDLHKILEDKVDIPTKMWDLSFGVHRMALKAPLSEYGVEDQSTLWLQPRKYEQRVEEQPLTLIIKQVGTERTTQMKFNTGYTIGKCKQEIEATLTVHIGGCFLRKHGEDEDLDDDQTLGDYDIRDWATLDFGYVDKDSKVIKAGKRVVSEVKGYAHGWKLRHIGENQIGRTERR